LKVLIVGAGGQVGRALIASVPATVDLAAYARSELDITDADAVTRRLRADAPDLIINTAAYTAVDKAESEPELARRVNVAGPRHLALAARELGARLIHLSTDFVFDGSASVPHSPGAPTHPLNVYGVTKRDGEEAAIAALAGRALVLRTAWVYSAVGRNFLLTMLRLMRSGEPVRVVSDQIGTPTAARSLARAIWWLAERVEVNGVHHWTDAGVASWYDFAVAIAEEAVSMGVLAREPQVIPIPTRDYPTPARRPAFSVLDRSTLTALGLCAEHWRKSLRREMREVPNA
jgi:dTDP-4-dehydrorhamnose reductase